jgi:PTS system mannose-specific IID component
MTETIPRITKGTWLAMFTRLLAVQGSWNYELLMGNGIAFAAEPGLRMLPETEYREALGREGRYFNCHPYLASVAVGSLVRAELERVPGPKIERFRTALCGPLGSVGDRLIWAGWLPACSLLALVVFGAGAPAWVVVTVFLVLYNAGHLSLRAWGLSTGFNRGMHVAKALAGPVFRRGPDFIARAGALLAGAAIPAALARVVRHGPAPGSAVLYVDVVAGVLAGGMLLVRMHGRVDGWRIALVVLAAFVLYAVLRHG